MKILLAPSEGKHIPKKRVIDEPESGLLDSGGVDSSGLDSRMMDSGVMDFEMGESRVDSSGSALPALLQDPMWGGIEARNAQILAYLKTLESADDSELCKVFGTKSVKLDLLQRCSSLLESPRMRAIELYSGVAFKALDFAGLDSRAQEFVLDSVLITSNLFGLVRARDWLPFYHLNQKYQSKELSLSRLYGAQKHEIDALLGGCGGGVDVIIDLRAQVYIKAYSLPCPHYTLEIPSGTSHQAKHYRGLALRRLAMMYSELYDERDRDELMREYVGREFAYMG